MKEWKPTRWALWIGFSILLGLLGTWIFRHNTIGGLANLIGIGISGGVMGVVSMIRSETIRWQDSHMRRVDNTAKVIEFYNEKVRDLVVLFMRDVETLRGLWETAATEPRQRAIWFQRVEANFTFAIRLATILHRIDQLAWLIRQTGYLDRGEVLAAVSSELTRFLLREPYRSMIENMRRTSSLHNLDYLVSKLKEQKHGTN